MLQFLERTELSKFIKICVCVDESMSSSAVFQKGLSTYRGKFNLIKEATSKKGSKVPLTASGDHKIESERMIGNDLRHFPPSFPEAGLERMGVACASAGSEQAKPFITSSSVDYIITASQFSSHLAKAVIKEAVSECAVKQ